MSGISFSNLEYLDQLYQSYRADPQSVDLKWRHFFEGWDLALSLKPPGETSSDYKVYQLIEAYRVYGHLAVPLNPIATEPVQDVQELDLKKYGFKSEDLDKMFPTCGFLKEPQAPLKTIIEALQTTYCKKIGIEYMGLRLPELEKWVQQRIEPNFPLPFSNEDKIAILHELNKAEMFETFLNTKYVGQKRFSLEGGETFIPMMVGVLEAAAEAGVSEAIMGMAHRGRLNVLANIMNKSYSSIFYEFEDFYTPDLSEGAGDVKYHKGFVGQLTTKKGKQILVTLSANPSHLEAVDPVVEGGARARQEIKGKAEVIPILIHGDASVAGQGVVYETMQFCKLIGYETGGTVHIVINNQIGQTTLPKDCRSTHYCTDIAIGFGAPVFHVNAERPDECVYAAILALEIRQKFHIDVFLDLNCYRQYGHSEADEPAFTQPVEYKIIRQKRTIRDLYREQLIREGVLDQAGADKLESGFKQSLQQALESIQKTDFKAKEPKPKTELFTTYPTAVPAQLLIELADDFCSIPQGFHIHPKVKKLQEERLAMMHGDSKINWGMGEMLAYASLLADAVHIRLSGQDTRRGTFAHRHGMWVDQENGSRYYPLSHLKKSKAFFDIFNSSLSENAAMGFEFGYSVAWPRSLVIWEAQYGDFANGAAVVIDQFLSASEQKWGLNSGLVLMLPHGYEGGGPEHSSARIERYLQLCGDDNMQMTNCTTPVQLFHLLRRQVRLKPQKPLVIFTPKVLLRHPGCVSSLSEFSSGTFEEFLDDPQPPSKTKRILFCSGKIFYDLLQQRKRSDVAIIRIEQLYPFHVEKFRKLLDKYRGFQECYWVQEEHRNIGPWEYMRPILEEITGKKAVYVGRAESATPAAGSRALHQLQHDKVMEEAFL